MMLVQEHPESEQPSNPAPAAAAAEPTPPVLEGCGTRGRVCRNGDAESAENQPQRHKDPALAELLMGARRGDVIVSGHLLGKQKCGERGMSA